VPKKRGHPEDNLQAEHDQRIAHSDHSFTHEKETLKTVVVRNADGNGSVCSPIPAVPYVHKTLLVKNVDRDVVLDGNDHRLEDVHVPTVGDPQADAIVGFRQQTPAQRHTKIPRSDPQYDRLPHPGSVPTFHHWSPLTSHPRTRRFSGRDPGWPMVQGAKQGSSSVPLSLTAPKTGQNQKGFSATVNIGFTGKGFRLRSGAPSKPCDIY
jgi:hypothetical protein